MLDDTRGCPRGARCESCGDEHGQLLVNTCATPMGVLCLTQCRRCATAPGDPPIAVATARRLVGQHAEHLGLPLERAVALARTANQQQG